MKSILKSKTFWANLLISLSALFPYVRELEAQNPGMMLQIVCLLNIGLRRISKDKVYLI